MSVGGKMVAIENGKEGEGRKYLQEGGRAEKVEQKAEEHEF